MADRLVASAGEKFDLSIGARLLGRAIDDADRGRVNVAALVLLPPQMMGADEVYRSERRRKGKAQAGHYVTVVR